MHEIAQQVRKDARVVYVDNDPIVLVHGRALLETDDHTRIVQNDAREPAAVLADPLVRELIDFDRPVAVLFVAVLHFVADNEDPAGIVRTFRDAVVPGSHFVVSHAAVEEKRNLRVGDAYRPATSPLIARSREEVSSFLDGLEVVDPGVVPLHDWHPEGGEYVTNAGWASVARKR